MLDRASWRFWGVLAVICLAQVADADTNWQVQLQLNTGMGSVTMTFESVFKSNLANYIGASSSDIQIAYTGNANTVTALVTFTGVDAGGYAGDLQSSPINALSNALNVPIGTIGTAERVTEPPVTTPTEPPVTTPGGSPVAAPVQSPVNAPVHAPTAPTSIAGESPGPTELLNEFEACLNRCEEMSACPTGYCGTGYCCQSGVPDIYCGGDFGCDGFHCCTRVPTKEPTITQPPSPVVAPTEPPSASESVSPTAAPTRVRTFLVEVVMDGSNDQVSDMFKSQMKNNLAEFLGVTADDLTVEFSQTTSSAENDNLQAEVTFKSESTALQLSTSQVSDVTAALNTTVIRIGNVTEVFDTETKGEKNGGGGGDGGGGGGSTNGQSSAYIPGIVVGVITAVIIIGIAIYACRLRKKNNGYDDLESRQGLKAEEKRQEKARKRELKKKINWNKVPSKRHQYNQSRDYATSRALKKRGGKSPSAENGPSEYSIVLESDSGEKKSGGIANI